MLSTKATGTEFTTGVPGKVFYERRRERQAADGQNQRVTQSL
jgi:hypothetical protein